MASTINATPTSSGLIQTADSTGVLALQTGGTTAVTIDTSQNVGIGTSSPSQRLDVVSTSGFTPIRFKSQCSQAGLLGTDNSAIWMGVGSDGLTTRYRVDSADVLTMHTNGTERMRIASDGSVYIGVTSLPSAGSGGAGFRADSNGRKNLYLSTSSTANNDLISFSNPNGNVGAILTNGSATTYSTSSDYRLKENIAPMTGALATVQALKPVTYTWKVDGSNGQGFIAHELAEVVPDCVSGEKDAVNEDGSIKSQGIDTSFLVATLTAAIQELNAKVDAQALEIQALKNTPAENT